MRFSRFAPLCALLLFALPASAQTRVGIGARVSDIISFSFGVSGIQPGSVSILLPVDLPGFRMEPEVGVSRTTRTQSFRNQSESITESQYLVGVGLFGRSAVRESVSMLYGARLRYVRTESQDFTDFQGNRETVTFNAFAGGPFVGGEYFFSDRFALGAEAGLLVQRQSQSDLPDEAENTTTVVGTQTAVFARFFF